MIARVLPVGAFVHLLRELLESDPFLADLWLEGEVSDFSRSAAGHCYFTLRDDDGAFKCVLFRNQALRQFQLPVLGSQIAVHGGLTVYPRSGAVQLNVDLMQPAGLGAAALELEYLRQRLAAEGLFEPSRKRPLPAWPRVIGVVTSLHGAAWQDIQTVIGRRYPLASLVLAAAQVQGDGAAMSIASAIEAIQRDDRVDVVILARGGGASDDLAAFNDERVVRAVFACRVPVVAGVGHATDRSLAEDAADLSAPTPSAAAEICVPSVQELLLRVATSRERLGWAYDEQFGETMGTARDALRRLRGVSPQAIVAMHRTALAGQEKRGHAAIAHVIATRTGTVASARELLAALDPAAVLNRGYAALHDAEQDRPVFSVSQVHPAMKLLAILHDGAVATTVEPVSTRPSGMVQNGR